MVGRVDARTTTNVALDALFDASIGNSLSGPLPQQPPKDEAGAGEGALLPDELYADAGATIGDAWDADLVVKVAPPSAEEVSRLHAPLATAPCGPRYRK